MWVKFRLITQPRNSDWLYVEFSDEIYHFEDDDELGNIIWDRFYKHHHKSSLEFERIEKPPNEAIHKLIQIRKSRIFEARQDIERFRELLDPE